VSETNRRLPFQDAERGTGSRRPVARLVHRTLTNARTLVHTLAIMVPIAVVVLAMTQPVQTVAWAASALCTLLVWATVRAVRDKKNVRSRDDDVNPSFAASAKGWGRRRDHR
jgi:hypothetical protein